MPRAAAPGAHARGGRTSYLSVNPSFQLVLGTDRSLGPVSNLNTTGNRGYTRAHLLHDAGAITPAPAGEMHLGARSLERDVNEPHAAHL